MTVSTTPGEKPRSTRLSVLVPFGIVVLIWGSTWLVIRYQIAVVPPSWSVAYRFLIGGAAMLALAAARREPVRLDPAGWGFALALALSQFVLNFNFVYRAEHFVTSGVVAVVFALLVVPNALLARVFLGQRMGRQLLLGSAVALTGITLLFLHEARADPHGPAGVLTGVGFTLLAICSASTANVMQASRTAARYPMAPMLGVAMLMGAVMDAGFAWVTAGAPVVDWSPGYLAGVLYLGLVASALAFSLYFRLIRTIGPTKAAYNGVIVPVIAMLLSTIFEGYRWSLLAVTGAALAGIGLVIALSARRPNR